MLHQKEESGTSGSPLASSTLSRCPPSLRCGLSKALGAEMGCTALDGTVSVRTSECPRGESIAEGRERSWRKAAEGRGETLRLVATGATNSFCKMLEIRLGYGVKLIEKTRILHFSLGGGSSDVFRPLLRLWYRRMLDSSCFGQAFVHQPWCLSLERFTRVNRTCKAYFLPGLEIVENPPRSVAILV